MTLLRVFILLIISNVAYSQNLLIDESFEKNIGCPPANQLDKLIHWYTPNYGSSDYMCECFSADSLGRGSRSAFDNSCMIGLLLHQPSSGSNDPREYAESKITEILVSGKKYCATIYVMLAPISNYAISNIHVGFRSDSNYSNTGGIIEVDTFYQLIDVPLIDTVNWTKLSFEFTATGTEQYITIGNFDSISKMNVFDFNAQFVPPYLENYAYYFFDKITLEECKPQQENHFTVYPNPSNGNAIYIDHYSDTLSEVYLYNSLGQVVGYRQLSSGIYEGEIFSDLSAGIYILRYQTATGYREEEKVIVVK